MRAFPISPVPGRTTCFVILIILDFITTMTSSEERAHTYTFTHTHTHTQTHTHISKIFRNHTAVSASWPLKMGPLGCAETSIRIFHSWLRNSPGECSSGPLGGGSPKSPEWDVKPDVCTICCHVSPFHDSLHAQPLTDFSPYTTQNLCKSSTVQVLQFA